ncbi:MAG: hypothetical protein CMP82_02745 [Gammaproteobacteria bacterium]|nr:hypothetical protein [Gammaproteobacteria bacterium]
MRTRLIHALVALTKLGSKKLQVRSKKRKHLVAGLVSSLFLFFATYSLGEEAYANASKIIAPNSQPQVADKYSLFKSEFRIRDLLSLHPQNFVHDFANVLSPGQLNILEGWIAQHRELTTNELAVVVIPSLQGEQLEDFSLQLARLWGVGGLVSNNGALLLVAMKERKIRIEVGYGLESTITDAHAAAIIRQEMAPHFRRGIPANGIMIGVEALIETMQGSYYFEPMESQKPYGDAPSVALFLGLLLMLPLGIDQIQRRRRLGAFGFDIPEYYGGQSGAGGYGGGYGGGGYSGGGGFGGGGFGGGGASGGW